MNPRGIPPVVSEIVAGVGLALALLLVVLIPGIVYEAIRFRVWNAFSTAKSSSADERPLDHEEEDVASCVVRAVGASTPILALLASVILVAIIFRFFLFKPVPDRRPRKPTARAHPLLMDPRPKRRRFQFSLLSWMVCMTLIGFLLAAWRGCAAVR